MRDAFTRPPGGLFGLVCFARGQMGSDFSDAQMYAGGRFEAGMSFGELELRWILAHVEEIDIRPMVAQDDASSTFGQLCLLTGLFRRP